MNKPKKGLSWDEVIKEAGSLLASTDLGLAGKKEGGTTPVRGTGINPEPVGEGKK